MKTTTLRNRFAAVLLLAPVAAAVIAARPAHAQQYVYATPVPGVVVAAQEYPRGWERGADRGYRADRWAPRIVDVTPDNGSRIGERGVTRVSARFEDRGGSGIDLRTVNLRVDGRDVTPRTRIDGDHVSYREDLAPGRHYAELVVRDRAGNATRETWSFDVLPRHWGERYGYGYGYNR